MGTVSSLVTCTKPSKLENYKLKLNSKVNDNEIVLNSKAKEQYDKIYASYTNLKKRFQKVADGYTTCVNKKYVEGATIAKEIKKVAKNCETRGKACQTRQKDLENSYKEAKVAKHYQDLENEVKTQAKLLNELGDRVNSLESGK